MIKKFFKTTQGTAILTACITAVTVGLISAAIFSSGVISHDSSDVKGNVNDSGFGGMVTPDEEGYFAQKETKQKDISQLKEPEPQTVKVPEQTAEPNPQTAKAPEQTAEPKPQPTAAVSQPMQPVQRPDDTARLTADEAKKIALNDARLSDREVNFTEVKTDYEDGILVYEIEFYTDTNEYEYEINAVTGAVYNKEIEVRNGGHGYHHKDAGNIGSYISADAAKAFALSHAGLSAADVIFKEVKLDNEKGYAVYEIEFYRGRTEYEYKINALDGSILEYHFEMD